MGEDVTGIDVPRVSAWLEANVDGRDRAVHLRADRGRSLQPHLPRHRRGRPRLGAAAPARAPRAADRARHGARAHRASPRSGPRASRSRGPSPSAPTRRSTSGPSTSWSSSRGTSFATPTMAADELALEGEGAGRDDTSPRPSPASTRSSPTTSASARWHATTATSSASCGAGRASTSRCGSRASTRARSWARWARRLAARIPAQQRVSVVHGDYRLDNTVLDRRRAACARSSTGRSARSATRSRTSACCATTGRTPATPRSRSWGQAPTTAPGFETRDQVAKVYEQASGLDCSAAPLLPRVRVLEARLHPPGRLRALRGGGDRG